MAMAIHSAKIVCDCLLKHINAGSSREDIEIDYTQQWEQEFTKRMRNGAIIQRGLQSKPTTRIGVSILQKSPKLLRKVITSTHGTILANEF